VPLRAALEAAVTDLAARFGPDPATWRWGQPHQAVFANPFLSQIPLLGRWTRFQIESPGGDTTLDRGVPARGSFESVHGPEFRAVYDLADLDRSLFVVAPGQSGNPLSSHADDFLHRWRDGQMIMLGSGRLGSTGAPTGSPTDTSITARIRLLP
jgi:penicillin amidase